MARKKCKGTELAVFKGREAKLNRAIIRFLVVQSPQTIWDLQKQIIETRGLRATRYHNTNKRVKDLEIKGYIKSIGEKQTKAGGKAVLYEATAKAIFALLVGSLSLDDLIAELDELSLLTIVSIVAAR